MAKNDKSMRLQALRDLLHLKGRHEATFKKKIEIIAEIAGMIHSPRNLSYCRREAAKLRATTPDPTPEQTQLFGVLDDRLFRKAELIKNRQEKKAARLGLKNRGPKLPQPTTPAAGDLMAKWQQMLEGSKHDSP